MKPSTSVALSPESIITRSSKQHYFSDGTPVKGTFQTKERIYVNEDGVTVYEKPTTLKYMENLKRIIAEIKAENLSSHP